MGPFVTIEHVIAHCRVTVHCILYTVHCILYTVFCTLYTVKALFLLNDPNSVLKMIWKKFGSKKVFSLGFYMKYTPFYTVKTVKKRSQIFYLGTQCAIFGTLKMAKMGSRQEKSHGRTYFLIFLFRARAYFVSL